jgi:hypothetical protein
MRDKAKPKPTANGQAAKDAGVAGIELPGEAPDPLPGDELAQLRERFPTTFDLGRYDDDQSRQDLASPGRARRPPRLGRLPVDQQLHPRVEHLRWHHTQVFQGQVE